MNTPLTTTSEFGLDVSLAQTRRLVSTTIVLFMTPITDWSARKRSHAMIHGNWFIALAVAALMQMFPIASTALSTGPNEPQDVIRATIDTLRTTVQREATSLQNQPQRAVEIVDRVVTPSIDMPRVTRLILGRHWNSLTGPQREEFSQAFRRWLLHGYASNVGDYADATVTFPNPVSPQEHDTEATVRSQIVVAAGEAKRVDYRLHKVAGTWKVYDVIAEGMSFVATYRNTLDEDLHRRGVEQLIADLKTQTKQHESTQTTLGTAVP
jgi:phospholipid transport system substrate-binding protein